MAALHNDGEQYRIVMEKRADDAIIERHESNGQLFDAYFSISKALLDFLATSCDEIRGVSGKRCNRRLVS